MAFKYYIKNWALVAQPEDFVPGPEIQATNIASILTVKVATILSTTDSTVIARYIGNDPSCTVSGSNEENVIIKIPEECIPIGFKVEGTPDNADNENRRVIQFTGAGVPANTSSAKLYVPAVIRSALTTSFGGPSATTPWSIDAGSPGDYEIIGVGTSTSPGLTLRINNLNTLTDRHLIQFLW